MASATPLHPSTKETSNYARLCHLLVDVGSCVLEIHRYTVYVSKVLCFFLDVMNEVYEKIHRRDIIL